MSTTNLKTIATQVSLLNRLLELLKMQELPTYEHFKQFGWKFHSTIDTENKGCHVATFIHCQTDWVYTVEDKVWNHPVTQKAWSDELVKVASELREGPLNHYLRVMLAEICYRINVDYSYYNLTIMQRFMFPKRPLFT